METTTATIICPLCGRQTCECLLRDRQFLARQVGKLLKRGNGKEDVPADSPSDTEDEGTSGTAPTPAENIEREPAPEAYVLTLELKLHGLRDPDPVTSLFVEQWSAAKLDDQGEAAVGVRFECPASKVTELADAFGFLLEADLQQIDVEIRKTKSEYAEAWPRAPHSQIV